MSPCFSCPAASLRCSGFDVLGATAPERLASVLGADLRHGGLATIPAGTGLGVVPVPFALALGPATTGRLELVLVGFGVATDPEPGPAQFNLQAVQPQENVEDLPELFCGLGGGLRLAGGVGLGLGVVPAFEDLKEGVVLVVDLLHGLCAAAAVGMVLHGQAAVCPLELVQGFDVSKVFHGVLPSGLLACLGGCRLAWLYGSTL